MASDVPKGEQQVVAHAQQVLASQVPLSGPAMGDLDALLARHRPRVYGVILKIVGDQELAAELTQEALLKAYQKLPEYEGRSRFGTWICGIAKYLAFNAVRKHTDFITEDGLLEGASAEQPAFKSLTAEERANFVRESAAACLDELEQETVYLRYVEGMPLDRITEILQLEGKTGARGVLQRCRRKLSLEMHHRLANLGHGTSFLRTRW